LRSCFYPGCHIHLFEKKNRTGGAVSAEVLTAEKKQLQNYSGIDEITPWFPGGEIKPHEGATGDRIQQSDIFLIGTVVGPKELSYGVFKDDSGLQEIFKIGEPVFGLGVLYRVGKDKVFVRKGGKIIEIPLEDVKVKEVKGQVATGSPASSSLQKIGRHLYCRSGKATGDDLQSGPDDDRCATKTQYC
jgi:hypothetical protein